MKADALTLETTLNSSGIDTYTIPQYQRPFTWNIQNFETLWEDLTEVYNDYLVSLNNNKDPESYFLGPVVFVKNATNRSYDIIDGQQRCTTFHVILWYLYRRLTDDTEKARLLQILMFLNRDAKLKVSSKDAATFLKIRKNNDNIEETSKMAECGNYFKSKINELLDPNSFSAFLREYTKFIVIVVEDYSKAWDLFIGLNGKGEPLNPTDLVKAFVCGRSDVGETAGEIWEEKILPLKDDSTAYLLFLSRFKSNKFVSEKNLFKEFSRLFPETITTLDIAKFSEIFYLFWHVSFEEIPSKISGGLDFSLEAKKSLRVLRDLGRRDFTTLLFKFAESFGIKSIFDESFLKFLASYQIRMAISRKRSRERKFVDWFKDIKFMPDSILNDDQNKDWKKQALDAISKILKTDAPDDTTFEAFVKFSSYEGNYPARIILRHNEEGERGYKIISDFQLEHLMPKTGTDFWYSMADVLDAEGSADTEKYKSVVNNIGNLFVIDATTNNEVKNKPFDEKKNFYQKSLKDWSISRVTKEMTEWKSNNIEIRAQQIAEWAKSYWRL